MDDIIIFIIQSKNHSAMTPIEPLRTLGSVETIIAMIPIDDKEQNKEVMFPVIF
jgi:hypothetical protein